MSDDTGGASSIASSALTLGALAAICTGLVALTHEITGERIEQNRQRYLEESLAPVLEGIDHDGRLTESTITIPASGMLPGNEDHTVYRIYADGQPIAAVFVVKAMDGYAGPIRLLVGLKADGTVNRVRVLEHRETPGLGDRIESSKTDWIEQFSGRSIGNPALDRWEIRRDDGQFDQLSGASVTSRAVVQAVRETLLYFAAHRDTVFAPDADERSAGDSEP
jgi:electron transport complex protein RnfG